MAAAPTIVQAVGAATTANSPTSITVTPAATQVGTTLLLFVAVEGTNPSMATPAGFTQIFITGSGGPSGFRAFLQRNNPGGINSVITNLSGTTFGAAALLIEIQDPQVSAGLTLGSGGTSTNFISTANQPSPALFQLWFVAYSFNTAAAFQNAPAAPFAQVGTTQTSTLGTANVSLLVYLATTEPGNVNPVAAPTLSVSTDHAAILARLDTSISQTLAVVNGPGGDAIMAGGSGYCGAIGGL